MFLGQKFPKSMEINLSGTVTFGAKGYDKQPFDQICIGGTAFVKVNMFIWLTMLTPFCLFLGFIYLVHFCRFPTIFLNSMLFI